MQLHVAEVGDWMVVQAQEVASGPTTSPALQPPHSTPSPSLRTPPHPLQASLDREAERGEGLKGQNVGLLGKVKSLQSHLDLSRRDTRALKRMLAELQVREHTVEGCCDGHMAARVATARVG